MNGYIAVILFSGLIAVQAAPMGLGFLEAECKFDDMFPAAHILGAPGGYVKFRQSLMGGPTLVHVKLDGFSAIDHDITHGLQINAGGPGGFGNIARGGCQPGDKPFNPVAAKPAAAAAAGAAAAAPVTPAGSLGKVTEDFEGNAVATLLSDRISLMGNTSVVGKLMSILDQGTAGQAPIVLGCCMIMQENGPLIRRGGRHQLNGFLISGIH